MSGSRANHTSTMQELEDTLDADYEYGMGILKSANPHHPAITILERAYQTARAPGRKNIETMSEVRKIADIAKRFVASELPEPSAPVGDSDSDEEEKAIKAVNALSRYRQIMAEEKETLQAIKNSIDALYAAHVDQIKTLYQKTAQSMMTDCVYYHKCLPRNHSDCLIDPRGELKTQYDKTTQALKSVHDKVRMTPDSEADQKMSTISGKFTDFVIKQQKIVEDGLQRSIADRERVIRDNITTLKHLELAMRMIDPDRNEIDRTKKLNDLLQKKITTRNDLKELTDYMETLKTLVKKRETEEARPALEKIEELRKEADTLIHSDDYTHYYRRKIGFLLSAIEKELDEKYKNALRTMDPNILATFIVRESTFIKECLDASIQKRKTEAEGHLSTLREISLIPVSEQVSKAGLEQKCSHIKCRADLPILEDYNKKLINHIVGVRALASETREKAAQKGYGRILDARNGITPDMRDAAKDKPEDAFQDRNQCLNHETCERYRKIMEEKIALDKKNDSAQHTYQYVENCLPLSLKKEMLEKKSNELFTVLMTYISFVEQERSKYRHHHFITQRGIGIKELEQYTQKLQIFLEAKKLVWQQKVKSRDFHRDHERNTPIVQLEQLDFTKASIKEIHDVLTLLQQEAAEMDRADQERHRERKRVIKEFEDNQFAKWITELYAIIAEIKEDSTIYIEVYTEAMNITKDLNDPNFKTRELSATGLEKYFTDYTKDKLNPFLIKAKQAQAAALLQRTGAAAADFQEKLNRLNEFITPNPNPDFYQDNIKRLDDLIGEIKQAMAAEESRLKEKVKAAERALM
ncbi:MAG TPA: hypothetical protein VLJ15_01110, partial [Gammaproteobacteria bacterium]|nr:hypothetical protein [Gammaproteobacteria bacterium]